MKTLFAVIAARAGSKRLPGKNLKELHGKPLIQWTIEAAQKSKSISDFIISTDDSNVVSFAKSLGCNVPFVRPAELATDAASSADVVLHAMQASRFHDYILLLQPTSPFRTAAHIDEAFKHLVTKNVDACVGFKKFQFPLSWIFVEKSDGTFEKPQLIGSNEVETDRVLVPNGALYFSKWDSFQKTKTFYQKNSVPFVMDDKSSIDIDSPQDFAEAEKYFL